MMKTITIVSNEDATVLYKNGAELRRDYEQLSKRFSDTWTQIFVDHRDAQAAIQPGEPKLALAKADRRLALLEQQKLVLDEHVARLEAGNATLDKIAAWLKDHNQALAEHEEVAERSKRFAQRHARFCHG